MNSVTHARTSVFRIDPSLRKDLEKFVKSLSVEGDPRANWEGEDLVWLSDVGDMDYYEDPDDDEPMSDGLLRLASDFLSPGCAVFHVFAGHSGFEWVGGGASVAYKDDLGRVQIRSFGTHQWMAQVTDVLSRHRFSVLEPHYGAKPRDTYAGAEDLDRWRFGGLGSAEASGRSFDRWMRDSLPNDLP